MIRRKRSDVLLVLLGFVLVSGLLLMSVTDARADTLVDHTSAPSGATTGTVGAGGYTLGVDVAVGSSGWVTALWAYVPTGATSPWSARLYSSTGTLLGSGVASFTAPGWLRIPLASPVAVSAGSEVIGGLVVMGVFSYDPTLPTALTGALSFATTTQKYANGDAFPTAGGGAWYVTDLEFTTVDPTPTTTTTTTASGPAAPYDGPTAADFAAATDENHAIGLVLAFFVSIGVGVKLGGV